MKRGNQPLYYVSSANLAKSTVELSLDDDDVPGCSLQDELEYEEGYHRYKLQMNAILHKVSPETKAWLNGGPKPRRHILVSPASRSYYTRGTAQSIEAQGAFSFNLNYLELHPLEHYHYKYFSEEEVWIHQILLQ